LRGTGEDPDALLCKFFNSTRAVGLVGPSHYWTSAIISGPASMKMSPTVCIMKLPQTNLALSLSLTQNGARILDLGSN
jgi:hypothetical protein